LNLARAGARHHDPAGAAYDSAQCHDLFVACAGAEAALAGLLFVAVSINLQSVLAYQGSLLARSRPSPSSSASVRRARGSSPG